MPEEKKENEDIVFEEVKEDTDTASSVDVVKKLKEKLQACLEERQEYLNGWQRAKADNINARREEEKKREEIGKLVRGSVIEDLLPVLDSFDLAFQNKDAWEKVDENWRKGVEYIHSQLITVFTNNGFIEINPAGEVFNPLYHVAGETVFTEEEGESGKIQRVIQKGYRMGEMVVRPARVAVYESK